MCNLYVDVMKSVRSGDVGTFRDILANTPREPDYDAIICGTMGRAFGYANPDMYRVMFELGYYPKEITVSPHGEQLNGFEKFIRDIMRNPVISRGDEEPNMGYILQTFDIINANIEGGLAGYKKIHYTWEDFAGDDDYIGYPEEIPEISYNLLNIFMDNGMLPCNEHPEVFMEFVKLGVPIPAITIHEVLRTDMLREGECENPECNDPDCKSGNYYVIELIPCSTIGKLIMLGWVNTLKQLYDVMPDVVIDADKYLDLYETQIEHWKSRIYNPATGQTVFDYFSDMNFAGILAEMRDFINSVKAHNHP